MGSTDSNYSEANDVYEDEYVLRSMFFMLGHKRPKTIFLVEMKQADNFMENFQTIVNSSAIFIATLAYSYYRIEQSFPMKTL